MSVLIISIAFKLGPRVKDNLFPKKKKKKKIENGSVEEEEVVSW